MRARLGFMGFVGWWRKMRSEVATWIGARLGGAGWGAGARGPLCAAPRLDASPYAAISIRAPPIRCSAARPNQGHL